MHMTHRHNDMRFIDLSKPEYYAKADTWPAQRDYDRPRVYHVEHRPWKPGDYEGPPRSQAEIWEEFNREKTMMTREEREADFDRAMKRLRALEAIQKQEQQETLQRLRAMRAASELEQQLTDEEALTLLEVLRCHRK